jgi:hypothetical protein
VVAFATVFAWRGLHVDIRISPRSTTRINMSRNPSRYLPICCTSSRNPSCSGTERRLAAIVGHPCADLRQFGAYLMHHGIDVAANHHIVTAKRGHARQMRQNDAADGVDQLAADGVDQLIDILPAH